MRKPVLKDAGHQLVAAVEVTQCQLTSHLISRLIYQPICVRFHVDAPLSTQVVPVSKCISRFPGDILSSLGRVVRCLWVVLGLVSVLQEVSAQAQVSLPCGYDDKACAIGALRGHTAQKIAFWKQAFSKPLGERIGTAPLELIEWAGLKNIQEGFPHKPTATNLEPAFLRDVHDALLELPQKVLGSISTKLAGIYMVDDLGGTGMSPAIEDEEGNQIAGVVVLDRSVLVQYTANAWATWKERTPFKPGPTTTLTTEIETAVQDTRKNAIQYILLHELGHVFSKGGDAHPPWNTPPKEDQPTDAYPFFQLSWFISSGDRRYVTKFDGLFPERKDVVYYLRAKLSAEQMLDTYSKLEDTNFSTLYSVTHPFDDFAEAFANYVHVVLMKKPFKVRIFQRGKLAKEYGPCWEERRCAEKRRLLETMLDRNNGR